MRVLPIVETGKDWTVDLGVRATIRAAVMNQAMNFPAQQFLRIRIAKRAETGRVAKGAVAFRIDSVDRAGSGVDEKFHEFAAFRQFRGPLGHAVLQRLMRLKQRLFIALEVRDVFGEADDLLQLVIWPERGK